jgi:bifunctional non-homologous end joining protein LigD
LSLSEYQKKRNFKNTPEPSGKDESPSSQRLYVIQKHAASRLHYDLRLEFEGVLKSWAIPKGPSLDPGEKRLAVHVEDHPIEYGSFEGVIPAEEYGGGTVMLWDQGTWVPEGDPEADYRKGRLHFEIHGKKLKGRWTLFKIAEKGSDNGKNWLLVKSKDAFAAEKSKDRLLNEKNRSISTGRTLEEIASNNKKIKPEGGFSSASSLKNARQSKMPIKINPQLPTLVDFPPEGNQWIHEIKHDGYRIVAYLNNETARLSSRNSLDWTERFQSIVEALAKFPAKKAIVDGEVVIQLSNGTSSFQALQNALKGVNTGHLIYYLFDILYCDGYDLTQTPLIERKTFLKQLLELIEFEQTAVRYSDHVEGAGDVFFDRACRLSLEGILSKDALSPYVQRRSRKWVKVKCGHRQEFIIGGYTEPSGSRTGFGSLLLGFYNNEKNLQYCGKVGTGFNQKQLDTLKNFMSDIEQKTPAFINPPKGFNARNIHWISPRLVAEVAFAGWTQDKMLRQAVFKGIREDKKSEDIQRETALSKHAAISPIQDKSYLKRNKENTIAGRKFAAVTQIKNVRLTNAERILYPEQGVTKSGLATYYHRVSDLILPHVAHRPLSLVRCPQGRTRNCFYQKHFPESLPDSIRGVQIKEKKSAETYIVIDDIQGLISLVQMGVLEIHLWNAREDRIERPDLMVLDLDPGPGVDMEKVVKSCFLLHDFLNDLGLQNFLKTSGGKGFHIVVPIRRRSGWDELKTFSHAVAHQMTLAYPDQFIDTISKKKRTGKIFIDYLRNNRGATSIAPYSTRARVGAPISVPLAWNELTPSISPDTYRIDNIENRLKKLKRDPWKDFSSNSQSITKIMKKRVGL